VPESRRRKKKAVFTPSQEAGGAPVGNPSWWAPVMLGLMLAGLIWVVVTYIAESQLPIPGIGSWNLAIGFALILAGFGMTMRWQ
jgi:hypothetical protein